MIPQDPTLFHRTLIENIRYGKLDASDEEVLAASKKAHCHEFIMKMPEKYLALVGERGVKLSGGQRTAHCHRPRHSQKCADTDSG